jgi:hypothetical protein
MTETILNKNPAKSADLGEETLMNVYYGDELERYKAIADITTDRLSEICAAERDGRLVVLPCKVGEIIDKYNELTKPMAEAPENYTTGYKNGHRNGQAELIAYLFQIDTGTRAEAEAALKGAEHE